MQQKLLKSIPLHHFDENGWLKPPLVLYLTLLFLSKGLIIAILSLASMRTGAEILSFFYPKMEGLFIAIGYSLLPAITIFLLSATQLKNLTSLKKILLLACLILASVQFSIAMIDIMNELPFVSFELLIDLIFYLILAIALMKSGRLKLFIRQFKVGEGLLENKESS